MTVLPSFAARPQVVSYVSCEVGRARMISTSFISGTGFMKCIPITSAGRETAPASLVMEIDEVFDARMAPGFKRASTWRENRELELQIFGRRLHDEVGVSERVAAGNRLDTTQGLLGSRRGDLPFGDQFFEERGHPCFGALCELETDIAEQRAKAPRRRHLSDTAPHLPCPDDADDLDLRELHGRGGCLDSASVGKNP